MLSRGLIHDIITTINQLALNPMQQANNFHSVLNALTARLYFFSPKMLMKLHYIKGRERGKKGKAMWPRSWGSPDPGSPAWILPGASTRKPKPGLLRRSAPPGAPCQAGPGFVLEGQGNRLQSSARPHSLSVPIKGFQPGQLFVSSVNIFWRERQRDYPREPHSQQEEKNTQGWVNHSMGWFRREKLNFISYTFHIPWKEVVKGSTRFSDKGVIDFPIACRKLHIFLKENKSIIYIFILL